MTPFCTEFFGNPSQQALQRRADLVWALLGDDPAYASHGRVVGLAAPTDGNLRAQIALARLQGVCAVEGVPAGQAPARRAALEAAGLTVDEFVNWLGGARALAAADAVAASRQLAEDLEIVSVDTGTPAEDLARLDALTQSCGVLLPMGAFIRGARRPSVCLFARDRTGAAVGATAAVAQFHPDHPKGGLVWWGMLATARDRRRQGIALTLGAHSMRAMRDRYGHTAFYTGIRQGNAASQALCARLGLAPTDSVGLVAIDPAMFAAERVTT